MNIPKDLSEVTLEKSQENVTGKMGLSWTYHSLRHFGLNKIIKDQFPMRKNNKEISADQKIMAGTLMLISGGERIEDIENLRADKAFVGSLGWKTMVSPDTFINLISSKRTGGSVRKTNEELVIEAMKKSEEASYTYDNDATYYDSEKRCAAYSYKEANQMSGLLGFIPELSGLCVTMDCRPGNVSPAKGILNQLRKATKIAKEAGKKINRFRSDSAAHNKKIFKFCDSADIKYFVSIDKSNPVRIAIEDIDPNKWKRLPDNPDKEYAEARYTMMDFETVKGFVEVRILVLRWLNPQPTLFDDDKYCYHVIGTNDKEIEHLEWLKVHNGRMNSENYNKEIKTGFSCDYTPSHDFVKSRNYFLVGILAYNMIQILKLFYLGEQARSWTIKTIRYWFIETCGKFIRHSRKWICKIINATDKTFEMFASCLSKIILNTA